MRTRLFAVIGVALLGLSAIAATTAARAASILNDIQSRGMVRAVTLTTIPPFAYKDEKGELVGLDIEFYKLVARELLGDEKKVEFVSVSGDGRWPAILGGQGDLGIGTLYMSRANNVTFTPGLYDVGITLLVAKDSAFKSLEDVNKAGVSVANLNNPQMAQRAKTYFPNATTQTFDQVSAQFLALRSKRVQAMQIDGPIADHFAMQNKDEVRVLNATLGTQLVNAIYSNPNDPRWNAWLATFVQELKHGSLYGDYRTIYQKWLGKEPPPQRP